MRSIYICMLFLIHASALAESLSPEAVYRRCYGQMARSRPSESDEGLLQIRSGKWTAEQACLTLINRAQLDKNGKVNAADPAAQKILRTFQSLHSSWFPNHNLITSEVDYPTTNYLDTNEMGYHFTKSLLSSDYPVSQVLTGKTAFAGIREAHIEQKMVLDTEGNGHHTFFTERKWLTSQFGELHPTLPQIGSLIGITTAPKDPYRVALGAGAMGAPVYILLNTTIKSSSMPDLGVQSHRGWSRSVLSDFMCRSLPVIRPSDVRGVDHKSNISFRTKGRCMQCHASMDSMAEVLTDYYWNTSYGGKEKNVFSTRLLAFNGNPSHDAAPMLYMRTYDGQLVDQPVRDVAALGAKLAESDDFYICTAKRYLEFFTGVDVQIRDFSLDPPENLKSPDLVYRQFVIQLGLALKKDQSLKNMIQKIFASNIYKSVNYLPGTP